MNVLIACEESQRVCIEFRRLGHRAFSCDIDKCSGGHPEWHIRQDCLPLLNGNCGFVTSDGRPHKIQGTWDIIIAHPPCTYLTVTGNRWFNVDKYGDAAIARIKEREKAVEFFMKFINANCEHIAVENPVGYISTIYRKPDQIVHPYEFGEPYSKKTCLWLKGLPPLTATEIVSPQMDTCGGNKRFSTDYTAAWAYPPAERRKIRSKTYAGIAKAMAEQWGGTEERC